VLLTGFREIKPNATKYNGETVTMVCTAIGKTEQGDRDEFFVLMHAKRHLGKQLVLGRVAFTRCHITDNSTKEEKAIVEWIWHNVEAAERVEFH
jgi:hypothetical protein